MHLSLILFYLFACMYAYIRGNAYTQIHTTDAGACVSIHVWQVCICPYKLVYTHTCMHTHTVNAEAPPFIPTWLRCIFDEPVPSVAHAPNPHMPPDYPLEACFVINIFMYLCTQSLRYVCIRVIQSPRCLQGIFLRLFFIKAFIPCT